MTETETVTEAEVETPVAQPGPTAPGLTLRPWHPRDAPALLAAHRDPVMRRWLVTDLTNATEARRWIDAQSEAWADGTRFSFAVIDADADADAGPVAGADRLLGHVTLKVRPYGSRSGAASEVGYWTVPEARGKGVAPRALEAVSRWAFATRRALPPGRLELLHAAANRGSCRVAQKCGYVMHSVLPPFPPDYPGEGHLHVRVDRATPAPPP
ncbi:GNAT family N-acetyltransferase [Streptomyces sp. NPDC058284]|uniref:GNAT family N-acetyltransferase n=1 Tax=unclassified Streptomyces TaxID=2593676 RepID=UPI00366A456F